MFTEGWAKASVRRCGPCLIDHIHSRSLNSVLSHPALSHPTLHPDVRQSFRWKPSQILENLTSILAWWHSLMTKRIFWNVAEKTSKTATDLYPNNIILAILGQRKNDLQCYKENNNKNVYIWLNMEETTEKLKLNFKETTKMIRLWNSLPGEVKKPRHH